MTYASVNEAYLSEPEMEGPIRYARRLSSYISDPGTIRNRCAERFDKERVPPRVAIERMIEQRKAKAEQAKRGPKFAKDYDNIRNPRFWTTDEEESLRLYWLANLTSGQIARKMGRSQPAVAAKIRAMGLR